MLVVQVVHLDPDLGLVGDRYGRAAGARQVTLVEAEHLATIASHMGLSQVQPRDLRRNIVTTGINLMALKERQFRIGSATLETTGECHPCSRLEENLGIGGFNAVRGLGGITARIVRGGDVTIHDVVEPLLSDLTV
jgi:MOSC domain-containing protein YiiM